MPLDFLDRMVDKFKRATSYSFTIDVAKEKMDKNVQNNEVFDVAGVKVKRSDLSEVFSPVLFGEVSNRPEDKQELEARVILNTALNRMRAKQERLGQSVALKDVLTEKNQYQAYQPDDEKSQYSQYIGGTLDTLGQKKKGQVESIVNKLTEEMKGGKFKDITEGAYYYQHDTKTGEIWYDNKKPLYK